MSPAPPDTSPVASVFAALGDTTRLMLLTRLIEGRAQSVVELTRGTGLTRQGVSKHLAVLEAAGVVSSTRTGRENRFAVRPSGLAEAGRYLERASRQWGNAAERLRNLVED
ncbi:ArsR/SmtB family transcription factor [Stappia sp.]|uniref:ArsR/SmtB family transcription factor n=1 Tax=Stappia sp. TaxID=1870903 RepID=UPI003A997ABA